MLWMDDTKTAEPLDIEWIVDEFELVLNVSTHNSLNVEKEFSPHIIRFQDSMVDGNESAAGGSLEV